VVVAKATTTYTGKFICALYKAQNVLTPHKKAGVKAEKGIKEYR
jgi:hypothetical protein